MKKVGTALAVTLLLVTAACGGGRPTLKEIEAWQKKSEGASSKVAACRAKVYVDSKLSDGALRSIVDDDKTYRPSKDDAAAIADVTTALIPCGT